MSDVSETAERSPETFGAPPARNGGPSVLSRVTTMFLKQREASVLAIAVVLFIYFAVTTTGRPPAARTAATASGAPGIAGVGVMAWSG